MLLACPQFCHNSQINLDLAGKLDLAVTTSQPESALAKPAAYSQLQLISDGRPSGHLLLAARHCLFHRIRDNDRDGPCLG